MYKSTFQPTFLQSRKTPPKSKKDKKKIKFETESVNLSLKGELNPQGTISLNSRVGNEKLKERKQRAVNEMTQNSVVPTNILP